MIFIILYKNQKNTKLKKIQLYTSQRQFKLTIDKQAILYKQIFISEYFNFKEKSEQLEIEVKGMNDLICLAPKEYMEKEKCLFNIKNKYKEELDNKEMTNKLRQLFIENSFTLSENVSIQNVKVGEEWYVNDDEKDNKYKIKREGNKLNIYRLIYNLTLPNIESILGNNYLFSIDEKYLSDFNKKIMTNSLKQLFADNFHFLSKNVSIKVLKIGEKWLVIDNDNNVQYNIKNEVNKLNIYGNDLIFKRGIDPSIRIANWDILEKDIRNIFSRLGYYPDSNNIVIQTINVYVNKKIESEINKYKEFERSINMMEVIEGLKERVIKKSNAVLFSLNTNENKISKIVNPNYLPDPMKKTRTIENITKDRAFVTMLGNLFIGEGSIPEQFTLFYKEKDAKFSSVLMLFKNKQHVVFLKKNDSLLFLSTDSTSFFEWNSEFSLVEYDYGIQAERQISVVPNPVSYKYDIQIDKQLVRERALRTQILTTFTEPISNVNILLNHITHYKGNEYTFYYDKICIRIKLSGKSILIENFRLA